VTENIIILALLVIAVALGILWRRAEKNTVNKDADIIRCKTNLENNAKEQTRLETALSDAEQQTAALRKQAEHANSELSTTKANLETALQQEGELAAARRQITADAATIAALKEELKNERENAAEKIKSLQEVEKKITDGFTDKFKNMAQSILEEKSGKFNEDSKKIFEPLLNPLKENLSAFRSRMDELHKNTTAERQDLKTYITQVQKNAVQMSSDADNLTRALKGDNKIMGDWGASATTIARNAPTLLLTCQTTKTSSLIPKCRWRRTASTSPPTMMTHAIAPSPDTCHPSTTTLNACPKKITKGCAASTRRISSFYLCP